MKFTVYCYSSVLRRWEQRPKLLRVMTSHEAGSHRAIRNILFAMNLTTVILLSTCLHVAAAGRAQKVTISLKDVPIQKVFEEVLLQADVTIIYDEAYFKDSKPVTIHVKDAAADDVIRQC